MGIHFREPEDYVQILEITPATRRGIEDAIERLIALLDRLDPDADLEPIGDDEETGDLEPDNDGEENGDLEPSYDGEPCLGWPQASGNPYRWKGADFDDSLLG